MAPTIRIRQWGVAVGAATLVSFAFIAACSSNDSNPVPPVYTVSDGAPPITTLDSGTPPTGDDGSTPLDDAAPDQDSSPAPPQDAAGCTTDAGCWSCTPASTSEFLNQCTSSQCSPFANATRLPNYDGGLPPLN